MSAADPHIQVTPDEVLRTRGLSNRLTDMTMEISPHGGHLVCIAQLDGCNVCWACCEPFDPEVPGERLIEKRPDGGTVPVGIHRKCFSPKERKAFSDMGGSTRLQGVEEVSRGLRLRRLVAKSVKAIGAGVSEVGKIIL